MCESSKHIKKRTGIKEVNGHKCRYTYARNMIKNDIDLETPRQALGHEYPDTRGNYSEIVTREVLERMTMREIEFDRDGEKYKSSRSWYSYDGPVGYISNFNCACFL